MKRHSFFLRLFLGNLLVVALLLALGGALFYEYVIDDYRVGLRAHQRADAAIMVEFFQRDWPLEPSQIDRICKQLGQGRDVRERMRITFVAADGAVLGDSEADPASMSNHKTPDRPEVLDALDGREGADTRASRTLGTHLSYLAKPVRHNGQVVGAVRLAVPAQLIVEQQRLTRHALAWFALAAAALAVALAGLLAWLWYAPLKHLTASAGQIASGDLSLRVRARGPKELAHLGEALNQMRQSLAQQIELIEHQRHDLQTVIASLDEGVIALDARGRIVLMNRAAGELFGVDHAAATGQWLQSIVSRPIVIDAYNQVVSGGKPAPRQMEIERQGQRRIVEILAARPSTLRRTRGRP